MYTSALLASPDSLVRSAQRGEAQLALEAAKARAFGKHFVAALLESLSRTLSHAPAVMRVIEDWPGDLASAGVIFRLSSGLHALARSGRFHALQAIYASASAATEPDPLIIDPVLALVLRDGEQDLLHWLSSPTQTNEVARMAGLAAVLMERSATRAMPCHLLELGASAGLNLNFARYRLRIGGIEAGDPASAVKVAPRWLGDVPRAGPLCIADARGVDLSPLDVRRAEDAERLQAFIWPGERDRSERLNAAISLAHQYPPHVEQGNACIWLARQLASPQGAGERRVVFHSMVMQYLPEADRLAIDRLLSAAGAHAHAERPLMRLGLEWNEGRTMVEVRVTEWDGSAQSGQPHVVARCHPYAEWFEWLGI